MRAESQRTYCIKSASWMMNSVALLAVFGASEYPLP